MVGEANLPPEIIADILIRLDVKSLMVLKCVCKLWCSIIKSRHFIRMHMERTEPTVVLEESLCVDGDDKEFRLEWMRNGLLLMKHNKTNKLRIRNPATKAKFDLPRPLHDPKFTGFVYLPSSGNYKVVNVFGKSGFGGCQVLTLGIDFLWRNLEIPQLNRLKDSQLDPALHVSTTEVTYIMWFSDASRRPPVSRDIVCIEMESEGFETVTAPEALFASWDGVSPMHWEDKLSLYETVGEELHVWVLEDYRNRKWADSKVIVPVSFLKKHADKSDKFNPILFSNGWFYFSDGGGKYGIWYDVKSRDDIICDEAQVKYNVKFSLRNPNASIPGDY